MAKEQIVWKKKPEAEDYDGTLNFLSLIFPVAKSEKLLRALRKATKTERAAKDLLRASNLPLLARDVDSEETEPGPTAVRDAASCEVG
jgi:hypothetical protein